MLMGPHISRKKKKKKKKHQQHVVPMATQLKLLAELMFHRQSTIAPEQVIQFVYSLPIQGPSKTWSLTSLSTVFV